MLLEQFSNNHKSISYRDLGGNQYRDLVTEIQTCLSKLGIIDPPADGDFGPITSWGIDIFKALSKLPASEIFDSACVKKLLLAKAEILLPLKPAKDLAGKIISYMLKKGYWISRVPNCVNIVYVEGINENAVLNNDKSNVFNDLRIVIMINSKGVPYVKSSWEATTEPGKYYTDNPMSDKGAARIKFGQYRAWAVGEHEPKHEALRQVTDIEVHRDLNKDYKRTGDLVEKGIFAINQHWGYDFPKEAVGKASAGCLVGRTREGHKAFMKVIKSDPRYKVNNRYRYFTAVLAGDDLMK
jgi:hypothetical protein